MERFLHFGRWTLVAGGILLATGAGLQAAASGGDPFSLQVTSPAFALAAALRLTGVMGLVIGMTALYLPASGSAGRFGLVAYYLTIANLVLQAGSMWSDEFVTGALAVNAPGVLDGTADDGRLGAGFLLAWVFNTAFILLGAALLRSRIYPRAVGIAVIVMGAITVLPMPFDGPVFEVIIGVMATVAGIQAVRTGSPSQTIAEPTQV